MPEITGTTKHESPVKKPPLSGSTYGVVWRGATARGAIERAPDSLRDMTDVGSMTLNACPARASPPSPCAECALFAQHAAPAWMLACDGIRRTLHCIHSSYKSPLRLRRYRPQVGEAEPPNMHSQAKP